MVDRFKKLLTLNKFDILVCLLVIAYFSYSLFFKIDRFNSFYPSMDYHSYVQMFWNSSQGRWLHFNGLQNQDHFMFQYHFSLILIPLALIYFVFPHPLTLYTISTLALSLSVIPLYKIGQYYLKSKFLAFLVCVIFLFYPPFINADQEGFAEEVFSIPLIFFLIYFLIYNKKSWFIAFLITLLSLRINMSAVGVSLGILCLIFKQKKLGIFTIVLSISWLLFILFVVNRIFPTPITKFNKIEYIWGFFIAYGTNPVQIITTMLTRPDIVISQVFVEGKMIYIKNLFSPLFWIPLLSPFTYFALPIFLQNMLSSDWRLATVFNYYQSSMLPFFFLGFVHAIDNFKKIRFLKSRAIPYLLIFSVLIYLVFFYDSKSITARRLVINSFFNKIFYSTSNRDRGAAKLAEFIPSNYSVGMDEQYMEHLSQRKFYYGVESYKIFNTDLLVLDAYDFTSQYNDLVNSDKYIELAKYYLTDVFARKDLVREVSLNAISSMPIKPADIVLLRFNNATQYEDLPLDKRAYSMAYKHIMAQPFIAEGPSLSKVTFVAKRVQNPKGNMVVKIVEDAEGLPQGKTLFVYKKSISTMSLEEDMIEVETNLNSLTIGQKYWLTFSMDERNSPDVRFDLFFGQYPDFQRNAMQEYTAGENLHKNDLGINLVCICNFYFNTSTVTLPNYAKYLLLQDNSIILSPSSPRLIDELDYIKKHYSSYYPFVTVVSSESN